MNLFSESEHQNIQLTPHTSDTVQKAVWAWIFSKLHQHQRSVTFRLLVRLQSSWYLLYLARAETSKNRIYNSKVYDLPTLPGAGVRDSGSRSANWWIIETIRTFHFGVTKVRIDELMNFLTQCELMNWWNDELMNWWIIEWQLMNWWIDELLEDELMNYWRTNWWIDELLIDELMNWWIINGWIDELMN